MNKGLVFEVQGLKVKPSNKNITACCPDEVFRSECVATTGLCAENVSRVNVKPELTVEACCISINMWDCSLVSHDTVLNNFCYPILILLTRGM